MNREQTIEAIRIMQAFVDGKEVQVQLPAGNWETMAPNWNWRDTDYRIKLTPVLRPWTADEVPLGAVMRHKIDVSYRSLIGSTSTESARSEWLKDREHSTDGGKTWFPCGVVEEAKP
tara:strand:+ start:928 stop:1278 length:351 start_codon:yes stop_codon:yes gene_type:complete